MALPSLRIFLLIAGVAVHSGSFHLVGSSWRLQTPGTSASTYTSYRYDNAGHRIREAVFSPDSNGILAGETFFEYDPQGRLSRSIVLVGTDTSSIAIVARDTSDRILSTTVRAAGNLLKYVDSNSFRGAFLERSWRTDAAGRLVSLHRFDSLPGVSTSDSTFALDASSKFALVQVKIARLDGSGRVSSEAWWQCDNALCQLASTRKMAYSGALLESVAGREGQTGPLLDSIHLAYDTHGNRIVEDWFDADRSPTQSWTYIWLEDPLSWLARRPTPTGDAALVGRELSVPTHADGLVVLDARGRVRWTRSLRGEDRVALPTSLARGAYLAIISLPRGRLTARLLVGD